MVPSSALARFSDQSWHPPLKPKLAPYFTIAKKLSISAIFFTNLATPNLPLQSKLTMPQRCPLPIKSANKYDPRPLTCDSTGYKIASNKINFVSSGRLLHQAPSNLSPSGHETHHSEYSATTRDEGVLILASAGTLSVPRGSRYNLLYRYRSLSRVPHFAVPSNGIQRGKAK